MPNRTDKLTDEFLENRAANPGDDLRDEDEEEYCDQQSHDKGRWQTTHTFTAARNRWLVFEKIHTRFFFCLHASNVATEPLKGEQKDGERV